jgi:hypothetical protein
LGQAGSMGALISIGLDLYETIKNDLRTKDEIAYATLIKIAFESANDSISDAIRITIKDIKNEIKNKLFQTFIKEEGENSYLPDHPVIVKFRSIVCDILRHEELNDLIADFVLSFNIDLEENANGNPDLEPYRKLHNLKENR